MVWTIFTCTLNKKTMTCDHEIRQYFNFHDNYRWKWGCGVIKMTQKFHKIMNFYNFTKLWDKVAKTLLWYTFLYRISNIAILWPLTPLKWGLQGWENLTPKIFRKFTSKSSRKCNKINFRSQIERDYIWYHTSACISLLQRRRTVKAVDTERSLVLQVLQC